MIGERYWANGITMSCLDGQWAAHLDFYDCGFSEQSTQQQMSTEGTLRSRYRHAEPTAVAANLVSDAVSLGIAFHAPLGGTPMVYLDPRNWVSPDTETGEPHINDALATVAASLGWAAADDG